MSKLEVCVGTLQGDSPVDQKYLSLLTAQTLVMGHFVQFQTGTSHGSAPKGILPVRTGLFYDISPGPARLAPTSPVHRSSELYHMDSKSLQLALFTS